jgi:glucose-1-phosphate thymidylyltransferase
MDTIKIAIPMAGYGTRLRPHTWNKPKPLVPIAGKTVLDYVLEQFKSLPETIKKEYIFIVGATQLEQIRSYAEKTYPALTIHFVIQESMRGQSDALYSAKEHLDGPMLMTFSDTLIKVDLSDIDKVSHDGLAWVKAVPDPRRFGVAVIDEHQKVKQLIEKPSDMSNNLAVVGFYYFNDGKSLISAIEKQVDLNKQIKNEFFLADAINIMLNEGADFQVREVDAWMDAGTVDAVLETNNLLLSEHESTPAERFPCARIIPPVYIADSAQINDAVIGPYVSIGEHCVIERSVIQDTIVSNGTEIKDVVLNHSLIGEHVVWHGQALAANLGDSVWMK